MACSMKEIVKYYEDGKLKEKGLANKKGKQGKWQFYNENGSLFIEAEYKDDEEHGVFIRYFEDGKIAIKSNFKNGVREGHGIEYYENGHAREEWIYESGEYSPINFWDEKGNQLMKDGTGKKLEEFHSGLKVEQYFENGRAIKEVKLNTISYGKFIPKGEENINGGE